MRASVRRTCLRAQNVPACAEMEALGRPARGVAQRDMAKLSGLSRSPITRLIAQAI